MDAENMTYEELAELMAAKQAERQETGHETVTVRGRTFRAYPEKLGTWRAFKLISALDSEGASEFVKVAKAFELLELITDARADELVEELGGDDAKVMDVLGFVTDVIKAVTPKNS